VKGPLWLYQDLQIATESGTQEVLDLIPLARRVIAARVRDPDAVEELVQETLARLLAARGQLETSTLGPYAIVTARHLVASRWRDATRRQRHQPRLLERDEPQQPDETVLRDEERGALSAALRHLPADERELLLARDVDEVSGAALAEQHQVTPGTLATRLSRARARLRLEYVLSMRSVALPTPRCYPVLLSLSAGDHARQRALRTAQHLVACPVCASIAPPLLERRRALVALLPLAALLRLRHWASRHPAQASAAAGTAAAVAAAVLYVGMWRPTPQPPPPPAAVQVAAPLSVPGRSLLPVPAPAELARLTGKPVTATRVRVLAVPADEGFWIGTSPRERVWVQLQTRGESHVRVRPGQRVSFRGRLVPNRPGFATSAHPGAPARRPATSPARLPRRGGGQVDPPGLTYPVVDLAEANAVGRRPPTPPWPPARTGDSQARVASSRSEVGHAAAAGEPLQQLLRVEAEALQQAGVLVGVDLVGKLLLGLAGLVLLAAFAEQLQDRALVDLQGSALLGVALSGSG
jgi:RNA polymerase sigma factor (sigma-70 family)